MYGLSYVLPSATDLRTLPAGPHCWIVVPVSPAEWYSDLDLIFPVLPRIVLMKSVNFDLQILHSENLPHEEFLVFEPFRMSISYLSVTICFYPVARPLKSCFCLLGACLISAFRP